MLVVSAECSNCLYPLPTGPKLTKPVLPPLALQCPRCKSWMKTTWDLRTTWTGWFIYNIGFWLLLIALTIGYFQILKEGTSPGAAFGMCTLAFFFFWMVLYIASILACLPAMIIVEPIIRIWAKSKEYDLENTPEMKAKKKGA